MTEIKSYRPKCDYIIVTAYCSLLHWLKLQANLFKTSNVVILIISDENRNSSGKT